MSYILEALRKSQQERELGQVPTLDSSDLFAEDKEPPPTNHWGLLAVGLASLAVVIALYAAFRSPTSSTSGVGGPMTDSVPPDVSSVNLGTSGRGVQDRVPVNLDDRGMALPSTPLVEAPGPRRQVSDVVSGPPVRRNAPTEQVRSEAFDPYGADLEEALQRQLEAESDFESASSPVERASRSQVPPDLVQDIEAFKQQVRREQGIPPPSTKGRAKVRIPSDPTTLRLTAMQAAQIPAYLMTAHVYDKDRTKRFVVINTLRYREGEQTREGFWVERIVPEGAVLSYLGNPFFVAR
ncbi:general secretion pathway protein GspB [Thiorhodococcus fuscus]|uniref:General secretion pathway protein GspB n=1 Tax=Thiorhodococcus fuscus TaxID=527200 RepID=A0ABW4Y540_9GAMM